MVCLVAFTLCLIAEKKSYSNREDTSLNKISLKEVFKNTLKSFTTGFIMFHQQNVSVLVVCVTPWNPLLHRTIRTFNFLFSRTVSEEQSDLSSQYSVRVLVLCSFWWNWFLIPFNSHTLHQAKTVLSFSYRNQTLSLNSYSIC